MIVIIKPFNTTLLGIEGFCHWKDGTIAFKKHEGNAGHQESVEMIVLPQTTKNNGELMSQQHAIQKRENGDALLSIIRSIKFLCR